MRNPKLKKRNAIRHAQRQQRTAEAWRLRIAGGSERAIAEQMGVSLDTVQRYLRETGNAMDSKSIDAKAQARALDLARLDAQILTMQSILQDPDRRVRIAASNTIVGLIRLRADIIKYGDPDEINVNDRSEGFATLTSEEKVARLERILQVERRLLADQG